jgi:hypothetical protein
VTVEMDEREAADVFDGICRRELGVSGVEFLRRWDVGVYAGLGVDEVEGLSEVVAAISLAR